MVRWSQAVVTLAVLITGCLDRPALSLASTSDTDSPYALQLADPVYVLGTAVHEPAIAQGRDATLFVAGSDYASMVAAGVGVTHPTDVTDSPKLWKSSDEGHTWIPVNTGRVSDRAIGNGDVDLAVGVDGVLYYATEIYTGSTFAGASNAVTVGASGDGGTTWTWTLLSTQTNPLGGHRPWVQVAPSGRAHVVWHDGVAIHHAYSQDRGRTWQETVPPHVPGAAGGLAVGPAGEIAIRVIPRKQYAGAPSSDGIVVSADGGQRWTFKGIPGTRNYASDDPVRWADPVAIDAKGTLFTAWGEGTALVLAHSQDSGLTWTTSRVAEEKSTVWFPWIRAGPEPGQLAITWFTSHDRTAFLMHAAHVADAASAAPIVVTTSWFPDEPNGGRGGVQYFQSVFLQSGAIAVATKFYQPGPPGVAGFAYRVSDPLFHHA